jgi:universal stress protein A
MINPLAYSPFSYRTILVGSALRSGPYPAVLRALNLAERTDGAVTVVHALEPSAHPVDGVPRPPPTSAQAQAVLARLQASHPRIRAVRVIADRSWVGLPEVARETSAELVVIGSHVRREVAALLGDTSDRIRERVDGDVLAVRSEAYSVSQPPGDFRRILVATDLGSSAEPAARRAAALADVYGAELRLLHVLEHFPTDRENDDITPEDQDPLEHQQRVRGVRLRQLAQRVGRDDAAVEVVGTTESAGHAVPGLARERGADLVVIGASAAGGLHALLRSTAGAIVHHAPCDVLLVRAQG